jgi:fructose-bisphosphate aldolase class I
MECRRRVVQAAVRRTSVLGSQLLCEGKKDSSSSLSTLPVVASSSTSRFADELRATAAALVAPGKGILAADESTGTIGKRFEKINVENNESNRRDYRELLFTASEPWENYISGVILYEETLFQKARDGTPLVDLLKRRGVIPGIKVDEGTVPIPFTQDETMTQGLTHLANRCKKYYAAGARFAKWRAVYTIGKDTPSELAIRENARGLALYAAICQANGLVPIVEPEVLPDGDHSIQRTLQVTEQVQGQVMAALREYKVEFEAMLLKPNMVLPGSSSKQTATPQEVARATLTVLRRTLPAAVPGVVFLSGGQSEEEATLNLNAINSQGRQPWALSFSYGRALQASALKAWKGQASNVSAAQKEFVKRAKANSEASLGRYSGGAASAAASESQHVANYRY